MAAVDPSRVERGLQRLQFRRTVVTLARDVKASRRESTLRQSLQLLTDSRRLLDGSSSFSKVIGKSEDAVTWFLLLAAEGLSQHDDDERKVLEILRKISKASTADAQEAALYELFAIGSRPLQVSTPAQEDDEDSIPVIASGMESLRLITKKTVHDPLPEYEMDASKPCRGLAIIINVENFCERSGPGAALSLDRRTGSHEDVKFLTRLFQWLKFDVKVEADCQENLYDTVKKYLTDCSDYSDDDCFACVLMSHGSEGHLYSASGDATNLENIFELPRSMDLCRGLANPQREIPKLFFIQSCRRYIEADDAGEQKKTKAQDYNVPDDCLLSFATRRGCPAYRYPDTGSCYVQCLVKALHEHVPKGRDLNSILTEVSRLVKEDLPVYEQSCSHVNQLHKKVVFPSWDDKYV